MGRIKTSLAVLYGLIVIIVAVLLGAYLLYGDQMTEMYNKYFGPKEKQEETVPEEETTPEDELPSMEEEESSEEKPAEEEEPEEAPSDEIEISARYPGKIVYTTDAAKDPAPYKKDCRDRGGTFKECGTTCGPDADFCIQVCAYTCENIPIEEEFEAPVNETYTSENFGVSFSFPSDMQIEKLNGTLRVYKWGPTQREGTELYDGIIISFMKPENPDNLDLEPFAKFKLEEELEFEGEVIKPVTKVSYGEFTGYEFTILSLGEASSFFFENDSGEIVRIVYFVEDPADEGFDNMLTQVLQSLENL